MLFIETHSPTDVTLVHLFHLPILAQDPEIALAAPFHERYTLASNQSLPIAPVQLVQLQPNFFWL